MTRSSEKSFSPFFSPRFWVISAAFWTTAVIALATSPDLQSSWIMKTMGDKVIHGLAFAVGAVVWVQAIESSGRVRITTAMTYGSAAVLLIGVAIELLQRYVPRRSADIRDFLADVAGVLFALLALAVLGWCRRRSSAPDS
ncbi:MAG: VanZ family protein [bacterium]|nr:VanZ family protein [bacterium]